MNKERRPLNISFVCIAFALASLVSLLGWPPGIVNIPTIHIVRLIATGMCFGATLVALVLFILVRYRGPD
jgi:hypothetical protein